MVLGMSRQKNDLLLLGSLFLLELSIVLGAITIYAKGERPFSVFLSSRPGLVFLFATIAALLCIAILVRECVASKVSSLHKFTLIVAMNLVTVVLILFTGELAIRILSQSSIEGETLGSRTLIPKNWEVLTEHNRRLLNEAAIRPTFYVYDPLLGWTIGPDRRSADGLYYSSFEGMRAPHQGVSFAKPSKKTRIALVGDSFTFGEDVAYEDTWGHLLETALGPQFEVLNFGVPGYGVDQAYLRYEKDVREWKPQIVILSFIAHDFERTMTVYTPLNYPTWDMPFSKPRMVLRDGGLKRLNMPPIEPTAIFSRGSVSELPFLEYDRGYRKREWQQGVLHHSYFARAFMTWLPRWETIPPDVSDDALVSVNASILKAFVQSAERAGAAPIVVYHPKREVESKADLSLSRRILQEAGVAYTEPTPCLLELDPSDWYIPHGHYTSHGNAAVAKCLADVVRRVVVHAS